MHLLVTHADGSQLAVPVNNRSVLNIKTWAPSQHTESGDTTFPQLVEDQSVALDTVTRIELVSEIVAAPDAPVEIRESVPQVEQISQAEADALDADAPVALMPWEQ